MDEDKENCKLNKEENKYLDEDMGNQIPEDPKDYGI